MRKLLVALAALVLALMAGQYGAQESHAIAPTVDFSIGVVADGCETGTGDTTCDVEVGTTFTASVNLNSFSGLGGSGGYGGLEGRINESAGLTYQDRPGADEIFGVWPDCTIAADVLTGLPGSYYVLCSEMFGPSVYTGVVIEVDYQCSATPSSESVTMVAGGVDDTALTDETHVRVIDADGNETLTINCSVPTPPPTPPPTPGPPGIGGIVDVVSDADAPAEASGSSSNNYLPIAAVIAGAIMALAVGGWYARRRWLS
jgi:type 1 fimbria pilin